MEITKERVYAIVVEASKDRLNTEAEVRISAELFKAGTSAKGISDLVNLLCL